MLKWFMFNILFLKEPLQMFGQLHVTLQLTDCTMSSVLISLWHWVKVKVTCLGSCQFQRNQFATGLGSYQFQRNQFISIQMYPWHLGILSLHSSLVYLYLSWHLGILSLHSSLVYLYLSWHLGILSLHSSLVYLYLSWHLGILSFHSSLVYLYLSWHLGTLSFHSSLVYLYLSWHLGTLSLHSNVQLYLLWCLGTLAKYRTHSLFVTHKSISLYTSNICTMTAPDTWTILLEETELFDLA